MKILVVDDQPINVCLLRVQLEDEGHSIVTAADGMEALERLEDGPVDAIVSDVMMPRMDGYQLCSAVRRDPRWRELPFIFHTATFTSPEDETLCYELGGDKYLTKPATAAQVLEAVAKSRGGSPRPPRGSMEDHEVMQDYSERLVTKLEQKNRQLAVALDRLGTRERQLRLIVEHSPAAIAMLDRDLCYLVASRRWMQDFGLGDASIVGRLHYEVFPEIPERWKEVHQRCLAGAVEGAKEEAFLRQSGAVDWLRWEVRPWHRESGEIGGIIMFSELITARKKAAEALQASEAHYRSLFEQAPDGILVANAQGHTLDANPAVCAMLGYALGELVGLSPAQLVVSDEIGRISEALAVLATGGVIQSEWQFKRRDGSQFLAEVTAQARADGNIHAFVRDITSRRQSEDALRESERRFSDLLRNVSLVSMMLDRHGLIMHCNEYLLRLTGWSELEVVGQDWFTRFVPSDAGDGHGVFEQVLSGQVQVSHESEILTRSGGRRLIRWNHTALRSGDGKVVGTASIGEDITARRQEEDMLQRRADDLERFHHLSVGRELQMIELKKRVNELSRKAGAGEPYDLSFVDRR